ncbi:ABC transporter permease [Clostridium sp. DJ247]|uniref:ABC transporter permease n=1 Tax=Clostridium sp. DJ247 TaxID=2726188 RepID=UPI00162AB525|nr:ABC transporter permease [Clostridium sp. DJ247]MBC2582342.1 ABC transporter permease [Clostridium sp. DJ247]
MKYFKELLKLGLVSWIFIIVIWEIASLFSRPDFLPGPIAVIKGGNELINDGSLFKFIFISSGRVLTGWALGSIIGIPIGLLIGKVKAVKAFIEPILNFFRFVPAIGFITLFILWFGIGEAGKIVLIMYATTFIVMLNTAIGVSSIQEEKIRAARCLGASERQILFSVVIPASIPHVFTGVRLAMGNSFAAIVGAEMLAANEGIGYLIWTARLYFKTEWVFIGLISLGLMGFITDKILGNIAGLALKKYGIRRGGNLRRAA